MSNDETQSALSRAHELVEAGQYDDARAILDPILADNSNNADAWWIYAHAVTDIETGRDALERVLRIDPNYPGAYELLAQARALSAPAAKPHITPIAPRQASPQAPPPPSLPEAEFDEAEPKEFEEFETEAPVRPTREAPVAAAPRSRRVGLPVIAIVAVIAVALVLLILLTQSGGTPGATSTATEIAAVLETSTTIPLAAATEVSSPTEEAVAPTELPLVTEALVTTEMPTTAQTAEPTLASVTSEPTTASAEATGESAAIDYAAIEAALSDYPIAESGVGLVETSLGNTLLVSACTTPGRAMRTLLPQVMSALAQQSPSLPSDLQAVGARMLNCQDNTPLLTVAVDLLTAQSYAQGSVSDSDFAATWKPQ